MAFRDILYRFLLAVCALILLSCNKIPETPPAPLFNSADLFLLIGQSNMEGEAPVNEDDDETISGVWLLNTAGAFVPATGRINIYSSIRFQGTPKYGLGASFAKTIHEKTGNDIALVSNARGGTNIAQWKKGSGFDFYEEAVRRTKEAMSVPGVTLKAILWHQGEGDSGRHNLKDYYIGELTEIVNDFRKDLGVDNLPFIVGEIGYRYVNATKFNSFIWDISSYIDNTACASAQGCALQSDNTHFSRMGYDLLGERYADLAYEMAY